MAQHESISGKIIVFYFPQFTTYPYEHCAFDIYFLSYKHMRRKLMNCAFEKKKMLICRF